MMDARRCPGGPSQRDELSGYAPCPGCGAVFVTVVDWPTFPPHLIWADGSVMFRPWDLG